MHESIQQPKYAINSVELLFLVHTIPIGVGLLGMVRFVADKSAHDAWISILISGLYPQFGILMMWLLLKRFQTLGLYDIHRVLFRKWIGGAFNLLFAGYCFFSYAMVLSSFVEVVRTWMFPMTPAWVLTFLFALPVFYSSISGLQLMGRYAIAAFFLTAWILLLTYYPFEDGTVSHIKPIGSTGIAKIMSGSLNSSLSLLGFELLLVFYPYLTYKKDFLPVATIANWAMVAIYVLNAVSAIMFFSYEQLRKTIWPMLTMFKHVQLPFIERFETIVISVWIVQVVNTGSAYLWSAVHGVEKTVPVNKSWLYAVTFGVTLATAHLLQARLTINFLSGVLGRIGLGLIVGYPLLLLLIALVLRKKGGAPHEDADRNATAPADSGRQRA